LLPLFISGGFANVYANFDNINNPGDFFKTFAIGGGYTCATTIGSFALCAAAVFAAPYVGAAMGVAGESAIALGTSSALCGGISYFYQAGMENLFFGTPFEFSPLRLISTMGAWGVSGGLYGYIAAKANGMNGWTGLERPRGLALQHRPLMTEPDIVANKSGIPENSTVLKPQKPIQKHHFATNKNTKYTPKMKNIVKKYDLDLDGEWNLERLPHQGRHPNEYHKFVYQQMEIIDMMPDMNQRRFINQFEKRVKVPIRNNPDMLNKKFWLQMTR